MSLNPTVRRSRTASGSGRIVAAPLEGYVDPGVFENIKQALHDLEAAQQDARDHPSFPTVVKTLSLRQQQGSIATTNLYLPPGFGIYELAAYQVCSRAGSAGTVQLTLGWTDETLTAQTGAWAAAMSLTTLGNFNQAAVVIVTAAGTYPITYKTTVVGATGSPTYDTHLVLTRRA